MLATIVLAQLLRDCASNVDPRTMTAIVRVESGGNRLALHDNTLRRSFSPENTTEAIAWANDLIGLGHSVDVGLSQINSANFPRLGITAESAFDPCTNLRAGATILGGDYASASARFGAGQLALRHALGAYNTGSLFAGRDYINQILVAAGLSAEGDAPSAPMAPAARVARLAPAPAATARPAYLIQHVPGSNVEVILGNP